MEDNVSARARGRKGGGLGRALGPRDWGPQACKISAQAIFFFRYYA